MSFIIREGGATKLSCCEVKLEEGSEGHATKNAWEMNYAFKLESFKLVGDKWQIKNLKRIRILVYN